MNYIPLAANDVPALKLIINMLFDSHRKTFVQNNTAFYNEPML